MSRPSLREERAQVTRRRIADAAKALFSTGGYGATTLRSIAAEAGVAVQTVYAVFGSKAGILKELRDSVVHDPEAAARYASALVESDAGRRLGLFASSIRSRWEHGATIVVIDRDAALSDPSIRTEVDIAEQRRMEGLRRLAEACASDLPPDMGPERAVAILDALTMPVLWLELVGVHGWSPDEYEAWLRHALATQLLVDPDRRRAKSGPTPR